MKRFFTILSLIIAFTFSAQAEDEKFGIIATIGDEAITNADLINRMKITIISAKLESSPEVIEKIKPRVMQNLINEKLQIQAAKDAGVAPTETEIEKAISSLEQLNSMQPGDLRKLLGANNVPISSMKDQIRGEISWANLRNSSIRSKVKIKDDEVENFIKSQNVSTSRVEYFINEIVIPVDDPAEDEKIKNLALKLKSEIEAGKDFKAIAKQFSQSATATNGGEVGWLSENQLPPEILNIVEETPYGQITKPVRSVEGYFLIKADESRVISTSAEKDFVTLRQFILPVKDPSKPKQFEAAFKKAETLKDNTKACLHSEQYAEQNKVKLLDFGSVRIKDLSKGLKNIVTRLDTGKISPPVTGDQEVSLFIVCEKIQDLSPETDETEKQKAKEFLFRRELELQSRKFLRDLRRKTNIDVRI